MIKTREQRKAKTLLQRRKIAIIISLILAVVLTATFILIYNYFSTVLPFTDYDGTKYQIKKVDGTFGLYDMNGVIVDTVTPLGADETYYETALGTNVYIDPATGGYEIKVIPDLYYTADGENMDDSLLISVFKSIPTKNMLSIEIHNQKGSFELRRNGDSDLSFILAGSPGTAISADHLSYLAYIVGAPTVNSRLDKPIKDANGEFSEYGLVPEKRIDADGNEYDYTPTYYVVTTRDRTKYKMIIGDRLIDGSGYYAQYENNAGVKRDAVYVYNPPNMTTANGMNFENTVLAEAKDLIVPAIVYAGNSNSYVEVQNFKINKRENGALNELICFTFIPLEERTGTVLGIHPYVFSGKTLIGYHPNYDTINTMLLSLQNPSITEIEVLAPSNDDKVAYGLMEKTEQADGSFKYDYKSAYTIEFERTISFTYTDENGTEQTTNEKAHQTIYISQKNENGNYYVYTYVHLLENPDSRTQELAQDRLNTICEVSGETMAFLVYDNYDWIYQSFMQIAIKHLTKMEIISKDYNATFNVKYSKVGSIEVMEVESKNDKGESFTTFGGLYFKDAQGYHCTVTPTEIKMYTPDGKKEMKPSSRHYEHNSLGEQVQVIDGYCNASNGDLVYVEKDYVKIRHLNGTWDTYLRYHNTLFKKLFSTVTATSIVDSYQMTPEEEKALIENPDNKLLTVKVTDSEGSVFTYNFYSLTARKSYITVGETGSEVGGFYVQSTRVAKFISDAKKFFAGEFIDQNAHK